MPLFNDDVSGFELYSPGCFPEETCEPRSTGQPGNCPDHSGFAPSFVHVPAPAFLGGSECSGARMSEPGPVIPDALPRRSSRVPVGGRSIIEGSVPGEVQRKPVGERWFYEPVGDSNIPTVTPPMLALTMGLPSGDYRVGTRAVVWGLSLWGEFSPGSRSFCGELWPCPSPTRAVFLGLSSRLPPSTISRAQE